MRFLSTLPALAAMTAVAWAAGSGNHGHDDNAHAVGQPGTAAQAERTVAIRMFEADGRMGFDPASLQVAQGETIRFDVRNDGVLAHEIVFGTEKSNRAHRTEMAQMPDMQHDDPNALRLEPGAEGEIFWTFTNPGEFQFACLIPGHMEAGMHGPIVVN